MNKYQVFITFKNSDEKDKSYVVCSNLDEQEFGSRLQQGIMRDDDVDRNYIFTMNNVLRIEWYVLESQKIDDWKF